MKRTVWLWKLSGFAFTSLFGTLLHFAYEWLGEPVWCAPFSGVNESTFEHMKLLFWPIFVYAIIESIFFKGYNSFWCVKLRATLLGLSLIPLIFYTYNGVIGRSSDFVNISIFFVAAAAVYIYENKHQEDGAADCKSPLLAFVSMCVIALLFTLFTFFTPHLAIFRDPISGAYGI